EEAGPAIEEGSDADLEVSTSSLFSRCGMAVAGHEEPTACDAVGFLLCAEAATYLSQSGGDGC
ncbi:hypothetical protein, partial [Paenibacillus sp. YIM B09110]|uniref:hypothetical protein n=1 Tax=Paenibacillus sp. YIM B09110 TaxID=3126102 RepID=UPI00301D45ED